MGIVIWALPFSEKSAGVVSLYRLCERLRFKGYQAFIAGPTGNAPDFDAPLIDEDAAKRLCAMGFAALYPEIVHGNPYGSKNVLRWVLNRPGFLGGDKVYHHDEKLFCFSSYYLPYISNPVAGMLSCPIVNRNIFYPPESEYYRRSVACYYVGKSRWQEGICDPQQTYEITMQTPARADLGKLLRASRVLYCFDNSTALACEAVMCGCPVVIIPDGTQTRQDLQRLELGTDGIFWGLEEFQPGPVDPTPLIRRYEQLGARFDRQVEELVRISGVQRPADPRQMHLHHLLPDHRPLPQPVKEPPLLPNLGEIGRKTERRLRMWRKAAVRHFYLWMAQINFARQLARGTSSPLSDPEARALECVFLGPSYWREGVCDREKVFEIKLDAAARLYQILILLRGSRRLYCFSRRSLILTMARLAGCPVVNVEKR